MSEKPLLIFPEPRTDVRQKKTPGFPRLHFPSFSRQIERLEPHFAQLENVFSSQNVELRLSAVGSQPEKVLVFETVGTVEDFIKALKGMEGLEWLTEQSENEIPADDDFHRIEGNQKANLGGRLYLIMSNQKGISQLLSLWDTFKSNPDSPNFERGRTKWRDLFRHLKNIRHWGPEDRLRETGLLEDWKERVELAEETINIEVELWYRNKLDERTKAQSTIEALIKEMEGKVLSSAIIEGVPYHAILAHLPIKAVEAILNKPETRLVQSDQVMFFKPVGQSVSITPKDAPIILPTLDRSAKKPTGDPIVALLDGMPLANHRKLVGYIIVDDPDEFSKKYTVQDRMHGTTMASLIINGELAANEDVLAKPIYARPILEPGPQYPQGQRKENLPSNRLFIDLIHCAVRRLFEEEGSEPPVAPKIKIINLSIGTRPFDSNLSSLAKLIDYLAYKYDVLFIISAGNHSSDIELAVARNEFSQLTRQPQRLEAEVLMSISTRARLSRLLSPSEAINCLTVAAVHEDSSGTPNLGRRINPYISSGLPSPINAQGPGFRRAIKPDILLPGGRQTYTERLATSPQSVLEIPKIPVSNIPPGQLVATPGIQPGDVNAARYTCGTSNATALATRTAALLYEKLSTLKNEHGGDRLDDKYFAVLLKALLVHGASWRNTYSLIGNILGKKDKETIARLLGYGQVQPARLFSCTDQRATLLGFGELNDNEAHLYTIPIPQSINAKKVWRRLTVTLAWLTPVNAKHNAYRRAALWFTQYSSSSSEGYLNTLQVKRREADGNAVTRGTVQHEIFEGDKATPFENNSVLQIQVNCRAEAGDLTIPIRYGLVFTFEVAENINLPIYQEISTRIRPPIEIKT